MASAIGGPVPLCLLFCFKLDGPNGLSVVKAFEVLNPPFEYLDGIEPNVQIIVRRERIL